MEDGELDPSELGTKSYWTESYAKEIVNFDERGDPGDVWFGEDSAFRVINWICKCGVAKDTPVIDLGCGNGYTLTELAREGFTNLLGIDYCQEAITLAEKVSKREFPIIKFQVLTALSFYATGSYQRPIAGIAGHSMAQQTASSVIAQVTACLDSPEIRRKYIVFPQTAEERTLIRMGFFQRFGFPGVIGCIDCTHIAIVRPSENEDWYYCRKHYHSLNVQLVFDIINESASVLGSKFGIVHDKGTYDAISLNPESPKENRLKYIDKVVDLLDKDGLFVITSCNWTEEELIKHFSEKLKLKCVLPTPQFKFGGKVGSMVSSVVFVKDY